MGIENTFTNSTTSASSSFASIKLMPVSRAVSDLCIIKTIKRVVDS